MSGLSREIVVASGPQALAQRVAERFLAVVAESAPGPFAVVFSGGSTPRRLYQILAGPPFVDGVPWRRTAIFFADERAVQPEHADSNFGAVKSALLDHIPAVAHRMRAAEGEAQEYERLIAEQVPRRRNGIPVLDIVLLGMGTDGHTASLFPETAALDERSRLVAMNEVPRLATSRMTITYPLINAAARVWVLVSGPDKRDIVSQVLSATPRPDAEKKWPILGVRPTAGELVFWLDQDAASGLPLSS